MGLGESISGKRFAVTMESFHVFTEIVALTFGLHIKTMFPPKHDFPEKMEKQSKKNQRATKLHQVAH